MELNKTKCLDCGHINRWHGYKWASTPERREHNRKNSKECPRCGSTNVKNHEDDETMGPYRAVAEMLSGAVRQEPNAPVAGEAVEPESKAGRAIDKLLGAKSLQEVGDAEKDKGYWRCECGGLNNEGMFAGPYHCFSCGRARDPEPTTFVPTEAGATDDLNWTDAQADAKFLRDLAERLWEIPVKYGVDQGDIDRLNTIADDLETPPFGPK